MGLTKIKSRTNKKTHTKQSNFEKKQINLNNNDKHKKRHSKMWEINEEVTNDAFGKYSRHLYFSFDYNLVIKYCCFFWKNGGVFRQCTSRRLINLEKQHANVKGIVVVKLR